MTYREGKYDLTLYNSFFSRMVCTTLGLFTCVMHEKRVTGYCINLRRDIGIIVNSRQSNCSRTTNNVSIANRNYDCGCYRGKSILRANIYTN